MIKMYCRKVENGPLEPGYRGSMDGTREFEPFFSLFVRVLTMYMKSTFCHGKKLHLHRKV